MISDRFVMIICSCFVENSVPISFGNGVKFEFGGPCNSDLYVYLNIEMVIGLVQWSSFAAMPSRTSTLLSCDCRQHVDCV